MFSYIRKDPISGLYCKEFLPSDTVSTGTDDMDDMPLDLNIPVKKRNGKRKTGPFDYDASDLYMKKYSMPEDLDNEYIKDPFKLIDIPPITSGEKLNNLDESIEENSNKIEELPKNIDTRLAHPYDVDEELKRAFDVWPDTDIKKFITDVEAKKTETSILKEIGYYNKDLDKTYIYKQDYQLLKQSHLQLHQHSADIRTRWHKGHIGIQICNNCCRIVDIWPATHKIEVWINNCPYCKGITAKNERLISIVKEQSAKEKAHLGLSHHVTTYYMY